MDVGSECGHTLPCVRVIRLAIYIMWFTVTVASIIEGQYYFTPLLAYCTYVALPERSKADV